MADQASLGDISNSGDSEERSINEEVPDGWKKEKLDELLDTLISGDRPTGGGLDEGDYISVGGTQINSNGKIELDDVVYIDEDFFENVSDTQLKKHDVLMTKDGAKTGEVAIAWEDRPDIVTNEHVLTMRMKEEINQPYAFYYLYSHEGWKQIHGTITGSAQEGINMGFAGKVDIKYPEKDEQRRIASVLYNLDQAIQKTEELISQSQKVQKGLMQDFFTEGYYNHEEFEEHQIFGKYPKDWKLSSIGELAESIPGGGTPKKSNDEYWGGDIPWASVKDFNGPRLSETKDYITEKGLEESSTNLIPENSIITSTRMGLGRAFINDVEMSINQDMKAIITTDEVKTEYLLFWIFNISDYIESIGRGTTVKGLSLTALRSIDVPLPPKEDQEKIVESLEEFYAEKKALEKEKEQLQRLKKGLMQDLLTGSVRTGEDVRVLDEVVEVEG